MSPIDSLVAVRIQNWDDKDDQVLERLSTSFARTLVATMLEAF
jgi:hypothetical protein